MTDLIHMRSPERITAFPGIVDIQEIAGTVAGQAAIRLWEDPGGGLAAFALLDGSFVSFEISPVANFEDLAEAILIWAGNTIAQAGDVSDQPFELETGCREEDALRIRFLERHGFSVQPVRTLHFLRSLNGPIPAPVLPEGFAIRPIVGEAEVDAWVSLHRAAHGTENMTAEFRRSMMRAPGYQPELDLVATAPDGRLAAYVVCFFSPEENSLRYKKVGYTDPVATHPDYQGKGLARALLFAGFQRLKEFGMEYAEVSTWGENTGMIRAAQSAGYEVYSTTIFFSRPIKR